jgi:hypothetical protein
VRDAVSHCIAGKLRIDRDATTVYLKNTEEEVDVRRCKKNIDISIEGRLWPVV